MTAKKWKTLNSYADNNKGRVEEKRTCKSRRGVMSRNEFEMMEMTVRVGMKEKPNIYVDVVTNYIFIQSNLKFEMND